jgi:acetyl esterase/lipase
VFYKDGKTRPVRTKLTSNKLPLTMNDWLLLHFVQKEKLMRWMLLTVVLFLMPSTVLAQAKSKKPKKPAGSRLAPTVADFAYAHDSDRQRFDFWQAKSDKPTPVVLMIHGGGWMGGDKTAYGTGHIQPFLDRGISVAAIDYRFIPQAMKQKVEPPVKAPLMDCARALQTIRSKAKDWNIDPTRIGSTGGSAGACTSLWLAFHDDLAKAESSDPVERESTRLTCAAVIGAQTSLDPKELREWIPNAVYGGHAFGFAAEGRERPEEFKLLLANREKVKSLFKEYSPIELVSKDDPPIYLHYPNQKQEPKIGQEEPDPTHSAMYGVKLAEKLKAKGVEVVLTYPGKDDTKYGSPTKFLIEKLTAK